MQLKPPTGNIITEVLITSVIVDMTYLPTKFNNTNSNIDDKLSSDSNISNTKLKRKSYDIKMNINSNIINNRNNLVVENGKIGLDKHKENDLNKLNDHKILCKKIFNNNNINKSNIVNSNSNECSMNGNIKTSTKKDNIQIQDLNELCWSTKKPKKEITTTNHIINNGVHETKLDRNSCFLEEI